MQTFDFKHNHPELQYPHTQFVQSPSPYNDGVQFSAVDTYASYLKSIYTREKLPIYDKWPQVKSKKYINLVLIEKEDITKPEAHQFMRATVNGKIDDIKKSKRAMDISQIAQLPDGSQPKCILVEGAPGVGKSTFAWKLCHKWGRGKLLQQEYQLVVLLRLRDRSVQAAKKISNLFRYHQCQIQDAVVKEIQNSEGKGVLLLLEGYDELPEELRTDDSVFLDVITGRSLPEATILVTSRPWASEFLHRECKKRISQHVEILGFTKANIQSYLELAIPNDPSLLEGLRKYILCYPQIGCLMYIPLNSAIVVQVYKNSRKDKTIVPKTMTELYSSLVRSLLLRYLLDHPLHGKNRRWRLRNFSDLPQDVYQQLCELCRIAYEGILHGQQVIFSDLPEDIETLDLMQCYPELYVDEGTAVSYNFLHLTVQEYLAAFHLSQQPVEKQIKHFREYKEHKRNTHNHKAHHFYMVLQFLSGIRKFNEYPSEVLNTLCVEQHGVDSSNIFCDVTFDTLHWLFEAQDNEITAKLLGSSDVQLHRQYSKVTCSDCYMLGYCISHSNCTWKISCLIGDEGIEMLMQGAVEEKIHSTGGISEIDLSENDITVEGIKTLLSFPKQVIGKLKTLNLFCNNLDSRPCASLACLIPHVPHLTTLMLSHNPNIGHGGTVPLMTSLRTHNSLEKLLLDNTGIDMEDCQALSDFLFSSKSLMHLDIRFNELSPAAIELIINGLHDNTKLERLYMWGSHFSLQNTISLASVLRTNNSLVCLDLEHHNTDGACHLASALCTNDTLQELYLGGDLTGVKGTAAFAEMLLKNTSLRVLSLQDNSIGEIQGTQKLIDSLKQNTKLEMLWLPKKCKLSVSSSEVDSDRVSFS